MAFMSASVRPVVTAEQLAAIASDVIVKMAGPSAKVRDDQMSAVSALVVEHRRALVVEATGWGKSAVYWIAAAALRGVGDGPVLVISPLLALMRDQVAAAQRAGLRAVMLNSANFDDWSSIEQALANDEVDVLLTSPERLASPRFAKQVLPGLLSRLSLLVVDEAHCISDWGFDFRPDYQRLTRVLTTELAGSDLPVLATTATANERVTADVAAQLAAGTDKAPLVQRGTLARTSLHMGVVPGLTALQRYAWVSEALTRLPGSGIVYTLTVAEAGRIAEFLALQGHRVAAYTGQLDTDSRMKIEDQLRRNELKAVVATSALGMGYDKPDVAFVLNIGSPSSPVAYYQQIGRAGRALDTAVAILLPAETDDRVWEYFASSSTPDPAQAERVLAILADADNAVSVPKLEEATGIRRTRLEALMKILSVDGAVERDGQGWVATGEPWAFDDAKYAALTAARRGEAELMRQLAAGAGCLMSFLRRALDDPHAGEPCGTCSVCTGKLPGDLREQADPTLLEEARAFARGRDVVIEPRKMWPGGGTSVDGAVRKGRIKAGLQFGRALAFADDPGWAETVAQLTAPKAADLIGELDEQIGQGIVAALTRWRSQWDDRPVAVVPIPSRRHPRLVEAVAAHIGEVGKLPVLHLLEAVGRPPITDVASGARAGAVAAGLRLFPGEPVPSGPLLLIDDVYSTGWTTTVAAFLLSSAGAGEIYPFVLHQRP
jgi:ATP-dependent DNA helicase RecQ